MGKKLEIFHYLFLISNGLKMYIKWRIFQEPIDESCKYELYESQDIGYADIQLQTESAEEVNIFRVIKPWTATNYFLVSYECCYDTFDCSSRNISLSCLTATPRKQKIVSTIMKICEELPNSEFLNFSVLHNVIKHQPSTAEATHS